MVYASHYGRTRGRSFSSVLDRVKADVSNYSNEIDTQNECDVLNFSNKDRKIHGLGTIHTGRKLQNVSGGFELKRENVQIEIYKKNSLYSSLPNFEK